MVLPLLIFCPLSAYLVFSRVMGKSVGEQEAVPEGINANLPDAKLSKTEPINKLGFYELAGRDTAKMGMGITESNQLELSAPGADLQTDRINERLAALNKELSKPAAVPVAVKDRFRVESTDMKSDVDRLEMLMKSMQTKNEEDPEMKQLGGMLQQIINIQHPELVKERLEQVAVKKEVGDSLFKAIPAVIVRKERVLYGASIGFRLQDSLLVSGLVIPKGHVVFGICRIVNQRLLVEIKNIRLGNSIVPVNLSVYGLDGMEGLDAPEAILADAVNRGAIDASGSVGLSGFDQTLVTQVAGAGIDAAKGLLSHKLRRVKVSLKAGEKVLLRDNQFKAR